MAYVPQHSGSSMSLRVIDMIALGRSPHRGLATSAADRDHVLDALEGMQLQPLAMRFFGELSGGERQRVLMARALAQQGRLLLLDEPTSDLDLRHQLGTLGTVRALADERGVGALIAIHDLALAARFCDRLVMLQDGRVQVQGPWQQVLTPAHLRAVYGVDARVGSDQGVPWVTATATAPNRAAA
ncbi:ABC transporter ATP-binding protein [Methylibium sp.]|uniref:ABC transporter ATP-binding protein n=1 Tax=Methylibium sp. TaxID=2067992 RepID=UPI0025F69A7D|nr:ABC transporter ATP-binding protein [Methylibium sp.]